MKAITIKSILSARQVRSLKSFSSSLVLAASIVIPSVNINAEEQATPPPATATTPVVIPDVVAEINSKTISKEALDSEIKKQVGPQFSAIPADQQRMIYSRVLSIMIERDLLTAAATKNGVKVSDEEVNKLIGSIKEKFPQSEDFNKLLQSKGLDDKTFHEGVRQDLTIKHYIDEKVFKDLAVTDQEAKAAFDANPKKFAKPEEVQARHILFRYDSTTDPAEKEAEVKKKAEGVLAEAKKEGADFGKLAEKYSEDSTKGNGGNLGYFTANQMVAPFSQAAFGLKPGGVSDLVKTRYGFHIIKVEDRRGGGEPSYEDAKEDIKQMLLQQKQAAALKSQLATLQKENKVVVYLK